MRDVKDWTPDVGEWVCCCDLEHRKVFVLGGAADGEVMTEDGRYWYVETCLVPVTEDGSCHVLGPQGRHGPARRPSWSGDMGVES